MVDIARVRSKLATLAVYVKRLRALARLPEDEYLDAHTYEGRYLVQAAAQICIDLANHLIASEGWSPAGQFREAFERLREHGVIPAGLTRRLQAMAGLRNRLVHLYDEVDDAQVRLAVIEGLDDLDDFARAVAERAAADL